MQFVLEILMNNKIFLPFFITTFLLSGYSTLKVVQASPPLLIAQSIWQPFSSTEGSYTVLLPGTPTEENRDVNTQAGSIPVNTRYVVRQNEAFYGVAYSDFPENLSLNSSELNQFFSLVVSGFSEGAGGKLLSQQNINLGNFPGREVRLQLARGGIVIGRLYLVNKRLYQVIVVTNQERNLTKSIGGFFKSFQLLNNSKASQNLSPEELNANLKQAVCRQNWPQALKAIDQLIPIAPSQEVRSQLVTYRTQLQGLANSRDKVPLASLPDCGSGQ
jgi:hypothetical protein